MTTPHDETVKEVVGLLADLQRDCHDHLHPSTKLILKTCENKLKTVQFDRAVEYTADKKNLGAYLDRPVERGSSK